MVNFHTPQLLNEAYSTPTEDITQLLFPRLKPRSQEQYQYVPPQRNPAPDKSTTPRIEISTGVVCIHYQANRPRFQFVMEG